MKKCWYALILAVLMVSIANAQPDSLWSRTYGGTGRESGWAVVSAEDGGYVLGGLTNSFGAGGYDGWLIKTNADGDTLWCRTFGGPQDEEVATMGRTTDGGYFMAGMTYSYGAGNGDFWLVKTDADGNAMWSRTYGGPAEDGDAFQCQVTTDGGYILAGPTHSFGAGNHDFWLVKTNANGDSLWSRTFGGPLMESALYVVQTADTGYMVAGTTYAAGHENGDFWLIKTDANGDSLWSHTYGRPWEDIPWCVKQTMDGGYIVVGQSARTSGGIPDIWLVKTSANGDSLWSRTYGQPGSYEVGYSAVQMSDGGYVIAGGTEAIGPNNGDVWLIRTESEGIVLWSRMYGSGADEGAHDFQLTADGGYIITGYANSSGSYDMLLLKTGPDPVSVDNHLVFQPSSYSLSSYPNPFNPVTEIVYSVPQAGPVSLRVYDILGRQVAVLVDGFSTPGTYRTTFDGSHLSSGIYFVRLQAGNHSETCKMVLLK